MSNENKEKYQFGHNKEFNIKFSELTLKELHG